MSSILGNELLRGQLVYLNRVTRSDLPQLLPQFQDMGYLRHLQRRAVLPYVMEDLEDWYTKHMGSADEPTFAIRTLSDSQLIGMCGFKDIRWVARHGFFWIGIGDPAMRGRGYGTDGTRVLLQYGFMELNLNCIGLEVFSYNEPALRSYQKVGFRHDGVVRAFLCRDGDYYDMHLMSMLCSEWEARYGAAYRRSGEPQT